MTDDVIQLGPPDDDRGDRDDQLPEHERDADATAGAGMMGSGGTAIDRGTGELEGTAQGPALGSDERDDSVAGADAGMVAGTPAGGAQPYVQAFVDDEEDEPLPDA